MLTNSPARLAAPIVAALAIFAVLAFAPTAAQASSDGIDGRTGTGCGGCHGSQPTGSLGVSISGPSTLLADETAAYTLAIDAGSAGSGGAFDIGLSGGGSLGVIDTTHTKLSGGEIVHTLARPTNEGIFSFDFNVTAPSTIGAVLTLAAVGMQFNNPAGQDPGDIWNFASGVGSITVVPEPATGLMAGLGLVGLAVAARRRRA
jgi:hypothetical protein